MAEKKDCEYCDLGASEQDEFLRAAFRVMVMSAVDSECFVFVDECSSNTSFAPLYGWSRRGERTHQKGPRNWGKNNPVAKIARDLDVSTETLRKWVKQAEIDAGERNGLPTEEKEELRRLRKEVKVLREECEIRKKSGHVLRQGGGPPSAQMIYTFIEAQKTNHRISRMCRVLRVSKSGFYSWRG